MKVLLYTLNYYPELTGIGKYNAEMAEYFVNKGDRVEVICATPYYPEWKIHNGYSAFKFTSNIENGVKVTRCPLYVPKGRVTTIKRLLHLLSFAITSSLALMYRARSNWDIIILTQPTLFCAPATLLYSKIVGSKAMMHVQDFEVEAFVGLDMLGGKLLNGIARSFESWVMCKFCAVSSISYRMLELAEEKGVKRKSLIYFPNWSDVEFVTPSVDGSDLKRRWGFEDSDIIVLYSGNIGSKQGLEVVLDAAKYFSSNISIKFVFVGSGVSCALLKQMAEKMKLPNVFFRALQPWAIVPEMLALADIHLVVQRQGVADFVLPSKLTNILSAGGHALITTDLHSELNRIADEHPGIYTCVEPENVNAFVVGIEQLLNKNLVEYNYVARCFAEEYLSKDKVLNRFFKETRMLIDNDIPSVD